MKGPGSWQARAICLRFVKKRGGHRLGGEILSGKAEQSDTGGPYPLPFQLVTSYLDILCKCHPPLAANHLQPFRVTHSLIMRNAIHLGQGYHDQTVFAQQRRYLVATQAAIQENLRQPGGM